MQYWSVRGKQKDTQGTATGSRDYGRRTEVTGGKQLDGFIELVRAALLDCGLNDSDIYTGRSKSEIPGYFRPTKNWDVVAVRKGRGGETCLVACVEIKSLGGPSFGNNFNNRVEEALGNATDVWTAYEREILPIDPKPFLGYLMLLEDEIGSQSNVRITSPHFAIDPIFDGSSYSDRMQILCKRLMRERVYDAAALVLASRENGALGEFTEPDEDLTAYRLVAALKPHVEAHLAQHA